MRRLWNLIRRNELLTPRSPGSRRSTGERLEPSYPKPPPGDTFSLPRRASVGSKTATAPIRSASAPDLRAPPPSKVPRGHVVVIGAGAAGLAAARELQRAGVRVTVL